MVDLLVGGENQKLDDNASDALNANKRQASESPKTERRPEKTRVLEPHSSSRPSAPFATLSPLVIRTQPAVATPEQQPPNTPICKPKQFIFSQSLV